MSTPKISLKGQVLPGTESTNDNYALDSYNWRLWNGIKRDPPKGHKCLRTLHLMSPEEAEANLSEQRHERSYWTP